MRRRREEGKEEGGVQEEREEKEEEEVQEEAEEVVQEEEEVQARQLHDNKKRTQGATTLFSLQLGQAPEAKGETSSDQHTLTPNSHIKQQTRNNETHS